MAVKHVFRYSRFHVAVFPKNLGNSGIGEGGGIRFYFSVILAKQKWREATAPEGLEDDDDVCGCESGPKRAKKAFGAGRRMQSPSMISVRAALRRLGLPLRFETQVHRLL